MTMARIRDDLVGSVFLGDGVVLFAGDTVPRGATVGEHLLAEEKPARKAKAPAKTTETADGDGDAAGE
ncbi:head-to-tail adaptor [Mycobacterium phage prophiGD51-2]|nr:head-to-tail adaptor [Mycobacterium phage prophiGD51-2]